MPSAPHHYHHQLNHQHSSQMVSDQSSRPRERGIRYVDLTDMEWPSVTYTSTEPSHYMDMQGGRQFVDQREEGGEEGGEMAVHRMMDALNGPARRPGGDEHGRTADRRQDYYWVARDDAHAALSAAHEQHQLNEAILAHRRQQEDAARAARPPKQHRVYLINCKSCDAFLTDRGMKAVLLLRPHITLFSTDAMPNCGPLYPPAPSANDNEPVVQRTCNCLTQTLGCYGCGNAVGYHIVSPCQKCTSSVAKHQRNSNGHRTVLHCAEIKVRERRYIPGEPGVMAAKVNYPDPYKVREQRRVSSRQQQLQVQAYARVRRENGQRRNSFNGVDEVVDEGEEEDNKEAYFQTYMDEAVDQSSSSSNRRSVAQAVAAAPLPPLEEKRGPRIIKRGDVVYWSDLVTGGERCEPVDSDMILDIPVCLR